MALTYRQRKRCKKRPDISWGKYIKRMKRYRRELKEAEMTINGRVFCMALLEGSNLEKATINIEKIARNKGPRGNGSENGPSYV